MFLRPVFPSATAAAALFVQEEAVKTEADLEDGKADEDKVEQDADEDQSEDAETNCKSRWTHLYYSLFP